MAYVGTGTTARPPAGMKTLAAMSRISSAPAPTRISAGVDAVPLRGRIHEAPVVGRRVLGQGRLEPAGGEQVGDETRGGRGRVEVEADDRRGVDTVSGGDLLVGRFPAVRRWSGGGLERHRRRAHRAESSEADLDRVAMSEKTLRFGERRHRRRGCERAPRGPHAGPGRTCRTSRPPEPPDPRARPPVGSTWLAPVA